MAPEEERKKDRALGCCCAFEPELCLLFAAAVRMLLLQPCDLHIWLGGVPRVNTSPAGGPD